MTGTAAPTAAPATSATARPTAVAAPVDELLALAARRNRIAAALTAVMVIGYFGFIAMVAFAKPTAGHLLAGGRISVGIIAGAAVIVLAPALTALYVRWANRHHDAAVRRLRGGRA